MKIKGGFVMREVMGKTMVVSVGETANNFRGMIKMNKAATHIWKGVEAGLSKAEIAASLVEKFEGVTMEKAMDDTDRILKQMLDAGILEA